MLIVDSNLLVDESIYYIEFVKFKSWKDIRKCNGFNKCVIVLIKYFFIDYHWTE